MDPEKIWEAVINSLKKVVNKIGDTIDAIGVNSHGETLIPLGSDGRALYRAIANFDTRAEGYIDFWRERLDPFQVFQITGMPLHGMYTVNKILWLRDERRIFLRRWINFAGGNLFSIASLGKSQLLIIL